MDELINQLTGLQLKAQEIAGRLNLKDKRHQIEFLQAKTQVPGFWQDETQAKKTMQTLSQLQELISRLDQLQTQIQDNLDLVNLALTVADSSIIDSTQVEIQRLTQEIIQLERFLFLSGPYDSGRAILSIHSGQGGTEAQDWAEMLKRMYLRYLEKKDWSYELLSESRGEEAGIKSAIILVDGPYAYGLLRFEQGTHRLVRLSPFNADNLRQTSFALVEVLPEIDDDPEIEIKDEDLDWQFFRAGGHGGQNVNKVSTAVRLTHKPSGFIVESQAERTQVQNRALALSLLKAKLWDKKEAELEKERQQLKGEHTQASWGTQIRSYVLHPYKLVKDNRTQVEATNAEAVLDGNLDEFIEAQIRLHDIKPVND